MYLVHGRGPDRPYSHPDPQRSQLCGLGQPPDPHHPQFRSICAVGGGIIEVSRALSVLNKTIHEKQHHQSRLLRRLILSLSYSPATTSPSFLLWYHVPQWREQSSLCLKIQNFLFDSISWAFPINTLLPISPVSHCENSTTWTFCEKRLLRDSSLWISEKKASGTAQVRGGSPLSLGAALPGGLGKYINQAWLQPPGGEADTLWVEGKSLLMVCLLLNFQPLNWRRERGNTAIAQGFLIQD